MEAVTLGVVQRWSEESETTLRDAYRLEGAPFPAEWDAQLERTPASTLVQGLQRWALLKHFYLLRNGSAQGAARDAEAASQAADQLLRREPITTELAGRQVRITGRSYNALVQIVAHHLRMSELRAAVDRIEELHATTVLRFRAGIHRGRARRRLSFLARAHAACLSELLAHRRALYAHALTPDGAAATPDTLAAHPAPWWRETNDEDDARLLAALLEVGRNRYARLGLPPQPKGNRAAAGDVFLEDYGIHSLISWVEDRRRVAPATLYDRDVGQLLVSLRAGAVAGAAAGLED